MSERLDNIQKSLETKTCDELKDISSKLGIGSFPYKDKAELVERILGHIRMVNPQIAPKSNLGSKSYEELYNLSKSRNIKGYERMNKSQLMFALDPRNISAVLKRSELESMSLEYLRKLGKLLHVRHSSNILNTMDKDELIEEILAKDSEIPGKMVSSLSSSMNMFSNKTCEELHSLAEKAFITNHKSMNKQDLVDAVGCYYITAKDEPYRPRMIKYNDRMSMSFLRKVAEPYFGNFKNFDKKGLVDLLNQNEYDKYRTDLHSIPWHKYVMPDLWYKYHFVYSKMTPREKLDMSSKLAYEALEEDLNRKRTKRILGPGYKIRGNLTFEK